MPHQPTTSARTSPEEIASQRQSPPPEDVTRRTVVTGTGMLAIAAALTACSSYGNQAAAPAATAPGYAQSPPAPAAPPPPPAGPGLARTTDIPVGGGTVFPAERVVVTQPAPADFRAFSATCTHQGCTVGDVANGTINCPCHGSKFAVTDGSVVNGPAKQPLPPRQATVEGNWVRVT